ncbi:MAG: hypothetical protein K5751_08805 [Treponemataceae bacterium]|nr:hypothetical protein [Treponemataceae bacterium]
MTPNEAVNEVVEWAIRENLLDGLIAYEKEEVMGTLLTEYNEEAIIKTLREDGYERGKQEKALETAKNLLSKGINPDIIAECTGLPLSGVQSIIQDDEINH